MFFFHLSELPILIFGLSLIFLAYPLSNREVNRKPSGNITFDKIRRIFNTLGGVGVGVGAIYFFYLYGIDKPPDRIWRDKNIIMLLERGEIIKGEVVKISPVSVRTKYFRFGGWRGIYKFSTNDPKTGQENVHWGGLRWAKEDLADKAYGDFSAGDTLDIIYDPCNPEIHSEIFNFLNFWAYRKTFKKFDKLNLLDKFRDRYEIRD